LSIKPIKHFQDTADWIGRNLSSPHQRFLQGVTGLAIQPVIEYKNKSVDDDTRAVATSRMIGKIFSGALVGIIVRATCIWAMGRVAKTPNVDEFARLAKEGGKKAKGLLAPSVETVKKLIDEQGKSLPNIYDDYRKGMGTFIGTLVGMYTNFAVDVPITEYMTEKLIPVFKNKIADDNKKAGKFVPMMGAQAAPREAAITPIDNYFIKQNAAPLQAGGANG